MRGTWRAGGSLMVRGSRVAVALQQSWQLEQCVGPGKEKTGWGWGNCQELPRILSWATAKLRRVLVTWELLHLAKHWVWVQEPRCCPEYPSPTTVVGVAQTQASANRAAGHTGLSGCLLLPAFLWFLFQVLSHELHLLLLECLQRLKFQSG